MKIFEQKEMKKMRSIKNICYDQLINYISEPITKIVGDPKETNTPKQTIYGRGKKLSKPKAQN